MHDNEPYKNSIAVEAEDAAFSGNLKEELLEETARNYFFRFTRHINNWTFKLDSARFIQLLAAGQHITSRKFLKTESSFIACQSGIVP